MKSITSLFLMLFCCLSLSSQNADPAVSGAFFTSTSVAVGAQSTLNVSFVNSGVGIIPANSIELTISTPKTYYKTNGTSAPSGPGAALFNWTYLGSDIWRGTNGFTIMPYVGGDIFLSVDGIQVSPSMQTTNVNVQVVSQFGAFSDSPANNNLQPSLAISQAIAACPTPKIIGDFYGCAKDSIVVMVDTFLAGNTYTWTVQSPAVIKKLADGKAKIFLPNLTTGSYTLSLVETDPTGCSENYTTKVYIESNSALVCDDNVFVSLNECILKVTPDLILEGQSYPDDSYQVTVKDINGKILPSPIIGNAYIGKTVSVSIKHLCSGNSCWGNITFEDKVAPIITCPDPVTVSCFSTATFPLPNAKDNCDNAVVVKTVSNEIENLSCDDKETFAAIRTIKYVATDIYGNVSEPCERTIYYKYENVNDIVFPKHIDDLPNNLPAFTCENKPEWDKNKNKYPDIEEAGVPTLGGNQLKQDNGLCKINVIYRDDTINICESSFKVLRKWTVLDWCSGEIIEHTQIIKVLDKNGPVVTCAPDFTNMVYTDPYLCTANYTLPEPTVIFDCSGWSYDVAYLLAENGLAPENGKYIKDNIEFKNGKYTIKNLPKGVTWIKYTVTDNCGNSTDCFSEVYVQDFIPPVAVCDQTTVVSLTNGGFAQAHASTFDDGSYDNCGKFDFEVARMQPGCGEGTGFKPHAIFCCDDIGKDIMVQMRVWDDANCNGIFGDEIDIFTDTNNSGKLGDVVNGIADRLVRRVKDNSNVCMVNVKVQDKANPVIKCPANLTLDCQAPRDTIYTGSATAVDNCSGVVIKMDPSGEVNQCGAGDLTRLWTATDKSGNKATCTQRIKVEDKTPFKATDINWTTAPDKSLNGCIDHNLSPDVLGKPTWKNDECSLVAASYTDQRFDYVDDVCVKILRKWTVIDWCTFNPSSTSTIGTYEYIQVIKISNTIPPAFTSCADITACIEGADCSGKVELIHKATDDCTPVEDLKFSYRIDLNSDGSIDRQGLTNDASGIFSPGKHKVTVIVSDGCSNEKTCNYILTVKDCKKPTPYCQSELITVIMNDPIKKNITIWSKDFDLGSFDNCPGKLKFSFSNNVIDSFRVFDCSKLGIQNLEMWVTDAAGNQDFCKVRADIQDNSNLCAGPNIISGVVTGTDITQIAPGVEVNFANTNDNTVSATITNNSGKFSINFDETKSYVLKAKRDNDILNGVSTLDLVLIQRHILGLSKFDSPYKIIAADANSSKTVSAADLVAIRKVILGITDKFPSTESWKFLDGETKITDNNQPWTAVDFININPLTQKRESYNFMGLKVGDVNGSSKLNLNGYISEPRSNNTFETYADDKQFKDGDLVKVTLKADKAFQLFGFQNTINFDNRYLEFVRIEGNKLSIGEDKVGLSKVNEGMIAVSWNEIKSSDLIKDDELFTMYFKAIGNSSLRSVLSSTSDIAVAEAYDENMSVQKISLDFRSNEESASFLVAQNSPNPFKDLTVINFEIGKASDITFNVQDVGGKNVITKKANYVAGKHSITVTRNELKTPGIYIYTITSESGVISKKMVLVD
jgi:hypothetical protein